MDKILKTLRTTEYKVSVETSLLLYYKEKFSKIFQFYSQKMFRHPFFKTSEKVSSWIKVLKQLHSDLFLLCRLCFKIHICKNVYLFKCKTQDFYFICKHLIMTLLMLLKYFDEYFRLQYCDNLKLRRSS